MEQGVAFSQEGLQLALPIRVGGVEVKNERLVAFRNLEFQRPVPVRLRKARLERLILPELPRHVGTLEHDRICAGLRMEKTHFLVVHGRIQTQFICRSHVALDVLSCRIRPVILYGQVAQCVSLEAHGHQQHTRPRHLHSLAPYAGSCRPSLANQLALPT